MFDLKWNICDTNKTCEEQRNHNRRLQSTKLLFEVDQAAADVSELKELAEVKHWEDSETSLSEAHLLH